jgi:hypothetical protein
MLARPGLERMLFVVMLLTALRSNPAALAADKDKATPQRNAAGILIDRKDSSIFVKVDGEDEPVEYLVDSADKKLAEVLKAIFGVSRVQLTYKTDGESRKLVSIKRQVFKAAGTVTGVVVKNHGWWIEVKPKVGVSDGYACNYPFDQNKDMMEQLKGLQEGDSVTISFTTDSERHRIQTLHKNPAAADKRTAAQRRNSAAKVDKDASKQGVIVSGIYIDGRGEWITVKADGEDEPVKYVIDASDKKLQEAFKGIFNACRVRLMYKTEGDSRRLVGIERQILQDSGTVTGEVVKVYNKFWVEVKPKNGLADAYAPGAQYNDKAFMEKLNGLKPGDSVTIAFNTDFERHRIVEMRINPPSRSPTGGLSPAARPPKK